MRRLAFLLCTAALGCSRSHQAPEPPPQQVTAPIASSAEKKNAAPAETIFPLATVPPLPEPTPDPPKCEDPKAINVFVLPERPAVGTPLRVVALSDKPLGAELRIVESSGNKKADGAVAASSAERLGTTPYYYVAEVATPRAGAYAIEVVQKACDAGQNVVRVSANVGKFHVDGIPTPKEGDPLWPTVRWWNHRFENMYSAWVEHLFDAPEADMPSWPALHEVLRDPKRNLLFDYLGGGEDSANAPVVRPDCADLPYMLRAYFAWKMRLPYGIGECNRGGGGAAPSCKKDVIFTNEDPIEKAEKTGTKQFQVFLKTIADKAHSGSARQPFEEENSDYYPVPLTWESLRPGTIYADPYGHVLVVAKKLPQTGTRGGVLFAVDGQPDGTVAKKRYWRGNFLYATQKELGGPGWKRFRPVIRKPDHKLDRADDAFVKRSTEYGELSREAQALDVEGFYDKMEDVLSPRPLDPYRAMMETLGALEEQVRTRVKSVDNGRKWLQAATAPASMPDGPEIFETSGAWEDFSTPSRDLRILIAIDVARGFPARVARRPERYAMPSGRTPEDVKAELEKILEKELASRSVQYTRTDDSPFTLTLAEVAARGPALEMAYNPNECVEARWGAPAGSDEAKPCHAHAPPEQVARMETYRPWFHERRRPPRR